MPEKYVPLSTVSLQDCYRFSQPDELPKVVELDDPASHSLIDFQRFQPITLSQDKLMLDAHKAMEREHRYLTLALDDGDCLVGLLSLERILGEDPVKLIQEKRIPREEIKIKDLMKPLDSLAAITSDKLRYAKVGNIIQTINKLKQVYLPVIDIDEATNMQTLRGVFLASRISQQVGKTIRRNLNKADSIAELQSSLA